MSLAYNNAGETVAETYGGSSPIAGLSVTRTYDQCLRRTNLAILDSPSSILASAAYGYDAASRLQTATDDSSTNPYSATYSYLANSPLVGQIVFASNGTTRMTTTKQYDFLDRLTSISSSSPASFTSSYSYLYNSANQRVRARLADGSYWVYAYDALGQVIGGNRCWPDDTPVAGQQFGYSFDTIGNRTSTAAGGDQNGANPPSATYAANNLNQYTNRTVPGAVDIMGVGLATSPVTVNGTTAYRKGEYFRQQLSVTNTSSAVWLAVTNAATNQPTITGNLFVPKTPETFAYDADGNLTNDGRWNYTWDAENRLVRMAASTSVGPQISLAFQYDWKGRRIQKQVSASGTMTNSTTFVYDLPAVASAQAGGWNLIAEINTLNPQQPALNRSYMWGLDLSGSQQGAGGVGGLLEINDAVNGLHFAAYDGNGNIAGLVNTADGTSSAVYEYGPFAELLRATGPMAKANPIRFSTKYQDDEADLLYYGHRYYSSSTGRWSSRDPLTVLTEAEARYDLLLDTGQSAEGAWRTASEPEHGTDYAFVHNYSISAYDPLGLCVDIQSGKGLLTVRPGHLLDRWSEASRLTFKVCCPPDLPALVTYGITAEPRSPWTPNRHPFPSGWSTEQVVSSPPCYTIEIDVPSRTAILYPKDTMLVFVVGTCCCTATFGPARSDPAPPAGRGSGAASPARPAAHRSLPAFLP